MDPIQFDATPQISMELPSSIFLPSRSYLGWKIVITLFHLISSSATVYRLFHRYKIRRLWWDDYIILGALCYNFSFWPMYWARFPIPVNPSRHFLKTQRILDAYWLTLFPYIVLVGSTRVSMALSLARIFPPKHSARRWAATLIVFVISAGIASLLFTTLTCKSPSVLLVASEMTKCTIAYRDVPLKHVLFFLTDLVCDSLLIISPLAIFWRVKLPPTERRLILIFFCGNVLPLLGALAYMTIANSKSVFALGPDRPLINLGIAAVNVSMGFMSCNMVVISTCFYRAFRRYRIRQVTPVQDQDPRPVVPPPEPPLNPAVDCTCMLSDHILPLALADVSITRNGSCLSNSRDGSRRNSDLHDMLDSYENSSGPSRVWSNSSASPRGSSKHFSRHPLSDIQCSQEIASYENQSSHGPIALDGGSSRKSYYSTSTFDGQTSKSEI